ETHNLKNVRKTVKESFSSFQDVITFLSGTNIKINGTLATAFGCPFKGSIPEDNVMKWIDSCLDMGQMGSRLLIQPVWPRQNRSTTYAGRFWVTGRIYS